MLSAPISVIVDRGVNPKTVVAGDNPLVKDAQ